MPIKLRYNVSEQCSDSFRTCVGRPREHDEGTRQALLNAAEALVGRGGLEAVSVRSVADEAGTSVRAVYSLFGSKEGLVRALAQRAFELLMEQVDSIPMTSDPATDLARAALDGFRPFALDHPDLFRIAFVWASIDLGPEVGQAAARAFGSLTLRIGRARAAGEVPDRPLEELGLEFHALCQGLATLELCFRMTPASADRMWTNSFADLMAGLQARAARESLAGGS
jgi:AcrR family transcriptional regulator